MRHVPRELARKLQLAADSFPPSFDDLRMDDIAEASGVPRATLYYYFAGKEEILSFLLGLMLRELRSALDRAVDGSGSTRNRLIKSLEVQLSFIAAHPAFSQLLTGNIASVGKLPDIAADIEAQVYAPMARLLADGVRKGELTHVDPSTATAAVFGAATVVGLQAVFLDGDLDTKRLSESLGRLFWSGLRVPKSERVR